MSERLTWSEAEAVVRAYRAENGMASDVDIATLAKTLGTSPAEVRRLAGRKRPFIDRSGVLSALLSLAVLAVAALLFGPSLMSPSTTAPVAQAMTQPKHVVIVDTQTGYEIDGDPTPAEGWSYPTEERATLLLPDEKTL